MRQAPRGTSRGIPIAMDHRAKCMQDRIYWHTIDHVDLCSAQSSVCRRQIVHDVDGAIYDHNFKRKQRNASRDFVLQRGGWPYSGMAAPYGAYYGCDQSVKFEHIHRVRDLDISGVKDLVHLLTRGVAINAWITLLQGLSEKV